MIFVIISYSLDTQVMLILILIDDQYSQKAVFSFQTGSHHQNHSSSGFLHPVKKSKFLIPPTPYSYLENPDPPPLHNNFYGIKLLKTFPAAAIVPVHCCLYTKVMLILILINVQYLQNAVSSFKNCLNG